MTLGRRSGRAGPRAAGAGLVPFVAATLVVVGCGEGAPGPGDDGGRSAEPAVEAGALVARSEGGMVVSGAPDATRVGVEILAAGGNAVDAAVAAAFALAVVEPTQSGLGGRTQALMRGADGALYGMDATTEVPGGYDFDTAPRVEHGYPTIGIPGTVAGLLHLLERAGTMERARILRPAVGLAREGFVLTAGEAERLGRIAREPETASPAARRYFVKPSGEAYGEGDRLVQEDLAGTLEAIAEGGADTFYRGEIAERIAEDIRAGGGFVGPRDLAGYRPRASIVTRGRYRDLELAGTYLPASGATAIEALQIMDHFDLADADPATWTAVVGQALLASFRDRDVAEGPPGPGVPDRSSGEWARLLTSRERAARRAEEIRLPGGVPGAARPDFGPEPAVPAEPAHTTHLSVVDTGGTAVAMTQSLGPTAGSRVATSGLGFLYAATLGGYLGDVEPGERAWSSQAPMLIFRDGELAFVLGGAGARRILSALVQTVSRIADQGRGLEEALGSPRFHPTGGTFVLERDRGGGWPAGVTEALTELGFTPELRETSTYFARLNVVQLPRPGEPYLGVADPRWPWGAAAGPP